MRPARESRASVPFQSGSSGRPERAPMPRQDSQFSSDKEKLDDERSEYTLDSPGPKAAGGSGSRPSVLPLVGQPTVSFGDTPEGSSRAAAQQGGADVRRKKSLVRPERAPVDPDHRLYNYRTHAAAMQADGTGNIETSRTGYYPQAGLGLSAPEAQARSQPGSSRQTPPVRRGVSILARDQPTDGAAILRRGTTLRKQKGRIGRTEELKSPDKPQKQPLSPWMIYVKVLTCCCPAPLLSLFGLKSADRQSAWREKIGILGICGILMAFVGFLTFGFTQAVCGDQKLRFQTGTIASGSMIFHGWDYSMDRFEHPGAFGIDENSNPLYQGFNVGGMDGTFLFQIVNEHCLDIITPASGTGIPHDGNKMAWYFPCNFFNQYGTSDVNKTGYADGELCHTQDSARSMFYNSRYSEQNGMKREGQVYFTWDQVRNESRNLGVYDSHVLDFDLLNWLDKSQVDYPRLYEDLARGNSSFKGQDITMQVLRTGERKHLDCLVDTIRVGAIDADTIGCVASDVVLYASLVVILGVVATKFAMAVSFAWFFSWRIGRYKNETPEQRRARQQDVEEWSENIYRNAPARYRPNAKKKVLPTKSRFTQASSKPQLYSARSSMVPGKPLGAGMKNSPPGSPGRYSSGSSFGLHGGGSQFAASTSSLESLQSACPFPLTNVVPQPDPNYEPFNFPLAHSICLVTAYSESVEGLRTTLDSLATTDYPNSHKLILVIADGYVKGHGNDLTTPDIVLTMMKDFVVPPSEVEGHSYVAIAHGHKRHNMAKVFAGWYDYDDKTVESSKQQRVPMVLVAKSGNMKEQGEAKPGNRGKRDSQVLLMTFLQKVMFDERMTTFEYQFFNAIWRCTGVCPDQYQTCLMVDADTKVFPDSLTRMNACMVQDPEIMGLCGETKIANKTETWVTMIQVFEYYLAHHQTKAFESIFGGVTCLPGCFSMYRIKTPKGDEGYWVPIIANPDIVEHYSENVVDTLHKKNLLLLGEDRYLSTLMLKTFPRRKMMFCPQAVCKTVVPDTFRVLLSQRRRWINSTVHNLFELLLVRDLCGTFCFSMQFVVFMDLVGTLVLPAAIAFTLYILSISCIPGKTKPTISLILLAFILGLPGVLIVITSRRIIYVGWMLIYLLSLPIWNFVFPFYSYLHMDDFSWGATRKIEGDKGGSHGDKEGVFDQQITMKRWHEYERERRRKEWQARDVNFSNRPSNESIMESASSQPRQPGSVPVDYSGAYGKRVVQMPAPLATGANEWPQQTGSSLGHHSSSNTSDERQAAESIPPAQPRTRGEYAPSDWQTGPEDVHAERRPMLTSSPELGSSSPISPRFSEVPSASSDSRRTSRYGGGVSLRDEGPAADAQPVKQPRARRESSKAGKRSSSMTGLPPGARPA